ncbi:unnamed protein product [Paramecium pentaurelia]|uniref:U1-type domain-containing protein n=1 Tax=Paramecium pentaurelia TaxID=43138 RepID=A0A8S1W6B6_9CILI|nr:unnamed protein product [Paramecium pentaurelia]
MNQFEQSDKRKQCSLDQMFKKYEEATYRYQKGLEEKKQRAKLESDKAREAQFIQKLEAQNKKIEFDEKLQESQERKKDIEKLMLEKQQQKNKKDEEVRRKKKENEDEKLQKLLKKQEKKDVQVKKVKKDVQKIKRKDELKILLDQSISDDASLDLDVEKKRQCKSLSDSLQALESDQIVYFKLQKQKEVEIKENKKKQKQKKIMPSKTFREQSVPTIKKSIIFPILIRSKQDDNSYLLQQILQQQQPLSPTFKNEENSSTNVTPKKEKEEEPQFFKLCQICNSIIENEDDNKHIQSKSHKQTKQYYNLTATQNDILVVKGSKDEISQNRFQSIRKRCQKIKQKIQQKSLQLENMNIYCYKEPGNSYNRQRIQKLSNDLDKLLNYQIKDLYQIEQQMKELLKLVNQETDLINLRQMKFIQIVIEVFKKISSCHKNEYTQYLKIIGVATEIVYQFCSVYNNRTYMLASNKLLPIIDFMYNFLASKPTKFIYSYQFVAQCFQIFSLLIKHKLPTDPLSDLNIQGIQEDTLEYMYCCGLFNKMKLRFLSFEKDYINSEGKIPVALVKSVAFIEAATNYHGFETQNKSLFDEEGKRISKSFEEHLKFVLKETELFGLIQLISQMVVGEEICFTTNKLLPQTIISFFMVGIKTLNNIARLNIIVLQETMNKQSNKQEVHMIIQRLVTYCKCNLEQSQDLKDLLNELILLIGYYCVLNQNNQNSLVGSMKKISVLHNLLQMPSQFYVDKMLKNILFPTLLCCMFRNPNNMKIVLDEMDKSYFLEILQYDSEQFYENHNGQQLQRSPSMSSTNSQNSVFPYSSAIYFKLSQRFPMCYFKEAYKELLDYKD